MPYLGRTGTRGARLRRSALCVALLACTLIAAGMRADGARAALTSSVTPLVVDAGKSLTAVSCPSASLCVASTGTQELAFNPNRFSRPRPHALFTGRGLQLESLWCSSTTLCTGIDFQSAAGFNPTKFMTKRPAMRLESVTGEGLVGVRCPSHSECVVIDSFGGGMTYNPLTRKVLERRIKIDGNERLTALACPSVSQCTALDDAGYAYTFQPRTGQRLSSFQVDTAVGLDASSGASDDELDAISCPTTKLCAAVDTLGNVVSFNPRSSAAFVQTAMQPEDPGNSLSAISCKPNGTCVAVDRSGNVLAGSLSSGWQLQAVNARHAFNSVACPKTSECVAVDNNGDAFLLLYPKTA